ncbi:MAG TPA: NAD(P)H-hydrate epimerase [Candidatus Nitrosotalea sp.]|nr:NAD(P)H-hydrate epimerase [Candidatus Nitrosotalea sp.]
MWSKTAFPAPLSGADARALDRICAEQLTLPVAWLMEAAGWQLARCCRGRGRVAVLCGGGGNGGDGLAAARHLHAWGVLGQVACSDQDRLEGAARAELEALLRLGVEVESRPDLARADLVLDALLGTGLNRPPEGRIEEWIELAGTSGLPVVAADIPSGLDSDSGAVPGAVLRADVTVALALPKLGLRLGRGPELAGRVWVADIGIPERAYALAGLPAPGNVFAAADLIEWEPAG